jgi:hypothetical protein
LNDEVGSSLSTGGFNPIQTDPGRTENLDRVDHEPDAAAGIAGGGDRWRSSRPPAMLPLSAEPPLSVAAVVEQGVAAEPEPSLTEIRREAAEASRP